MNNGHPLIWPLVITMALCGVLSHWLKQLITVRNTAGPGTSIGLRAYWLTHWPESLFCLMSTVGGIAFFYESGMLTHAMAYAVGFMGNSMADMLGGRVQAMVNAAPMPKSSESK